MQSLLKFNEIVEDHLLDGIPVVDSMDKEQFQEYIAKNKPVLIKNYYKSKALDWNRDYLIKHTQNVTVAMTPDGRADAITNGRFMLPYEQQMSLSDFFDLLDQGKAVYCQRQSSSLDLEFPELKQDVQELEIASCFQSPLDATNIWIGNEKSKTSMHRDPYENLYVVTHGAKQFTLCPPTDTPWLYKKMVPIGRYTTDFQVQEMEEQVPWVHADPDNPTGEYPLLKHCHPYHVLVERGDVLYLPSQWYHAVNQIPSQDGLTIAVNFWYDMQFGVHFCLNSLIDSLSSEIHQQT
ncbi:cupin-like domain-containing protein [Gorgonomyces haynaldii]|nr:cupin-like domain-containing protein [Gorgonomyces haynaldii]